MSGLSFAQRGAMAYASPLKKRKTKVICKHCKGEFAIGRYACPRCGTPTDQRRLASWNQRRARRTQ